MTKETLGTDISAGAITPARGSQINGAKISVVLHR